MQPIHDSGMQKFKDRKVIQEGKGNTQYLYPLKSGSFLLKSFMHHKLRGEHAGCVGLVCMKPSNQRLIHRDPEEPELQGSRVLNSQQVGDRDLGYSQGRTAEQYLLRVATSRLGLSYEYSCLRLRQLLGRLFVMLQAFMLAAEKIVEQQHYLRLS